jgi:EAL domain-containing protein (putative c-di-GMP-specific phosphodiesterase class I)
VISLARDLDIDVVAEGVETADQLEYLRQISCDEVQGYLISRPVAADAVLKLLDTKKLRATFAA